jgi:hypothetical protein
MDMGEYSIRPYEYSQELKKELTDIASNFFFLSDDRLIDIEVNDDAATPWDDDFDFPKLVTRRKKIDRATEELILRRESREADSNPLVRALQMSIERMDRLFSFQYGQQSKSGLATSHAIYEGVIKRVATAGKLPKTKRSLDSLIESLVRLSADSQVFEKYGISTRMEVDPFVQILKGADKDKKAPLEALLEPYIDTVQAHFEELRDIYTTIDSFTSQANKFFDPKIVTCRIGEGLRIISPNGMRLGPKDLVFRREASITNFHERGSRQKS